MNKAEPMLTTAELVALADFRLGAAMVSPSARTVSGPGGTADVEPRVMQVLVTLADAAEHVVTRETLFRRCWGGLFAGDDSLNRTIAAVRRLAEGVAAGSFTVETVPRTGYRLRVERHADGIAPNPPGAASASLPKSYWLQRREVLGAAAGLIAIGTAIWPLVRPRGDPRFDAMMESGQDALRNGSYLNDDRTLRTFEQAVALKPDSAKAWGLLAFVKGALAESVDPAAAARMTNDAEAAAKKALAIDPKEPNALTARIFMHGTMLGWPQFDYSLREVLSIDPANTLAMTILVAALQAAGRTQESWRWNERALSLEPMSPIHLFRKALKLWIVGRVADADKVIGRSRDLWPNEAGVWNAQFLILSYTGRPQAALAMLDDDADKMLGPKAAAAVWRASLAALGDPTTANVARAKVANLEAARTAPGLAAHAVMTLSALGDVDAAFDVARGFLLSSGPVVLREQKNAPQSWVSDRGWRMTQWLFTPPAAAMRADPRFLPLCDAIGIGDYWRKRGIRPDYQVRPLPLLA